MRSSVHLVHPRSVGPPTSLAAASSGDASTTPVQLVGPPDNLPQLGAPRDKLRRHRLRDWAQVLAWMFLHPPSSGGELCTGGIVADLREWNKDMFELASLTAKLLRSSNSLKFPNK